MCHGLLTSGSLLMSFLILLTFAAAHYLMFATLSPSVSFSLCQKMRHGFSMSGSLLMSAVKSNKLTFAKVS